MSGNFSKVGRRCSPSGFINNDIPSSGVIQNVKHRQNFKGKKRGLSGGEIKEGKAAGYDSHHWRCLLCFSLVELVCKDLAKLGKRQ